MHKQHPTQPASMATLSAGFDRASGIRARGFFQSEYDGSWWQAFADDRPNKFFGHESNLPENIRAALNAAQKVSP